MIQADKESYAETLMVVMGAARQAHVNIAIAAVN
jgi:hypothetical protein